MSLDQQGSTGSLWLQHLVQGSLQDTTKSTLLLQRNDQTKLKYDCTEGAAPLEEGSSVLTLQGKRNRQPPEASLKPPPVHDALMRLRASLFTESDQTLLGWRQAPQSTRLPRCPPVQGLCLAVPGCPGGILRSTGQDAAFHPPDKLLWVTISSRICLLGSRGLMAVKSCACMFKPSMGPHFPRGWGSQRHASFC